MLIKELFNTSISVNGPQGKIADREIKIRDDGTAQVNLNSENGILSSCVMNLKEEFMTQLDEINARLSQIQVEGQTLEELGNKDLYVRFMKGD
jgi:hypothetical protein